VNTTTATGLGLSATQINMALLSCDRLVLKACFEMMSLDCALAAVSRNDTTRQFLDVREVTEKVRRSLMPSGHHL